MPRKNSKRLNVYLPDSIHSELKAIAKKRYMTITGLILQIIEGRIAWEKKYE